MPPRKRQAAAQVIDLTGDDASPHSQARIKSARYAPYPYPLSALSQRTWSSLEAEEDLQNEVIPSTQIENNGTAWVEYGVVDLKIVGIRYYDGYVNPGEHVIVTREPHNQYDSNAMRVDNVDGQQVGHIPRQVAAKLAEFIDRKVITVEGIVTGEKGHFDCPLRLVVFGSSDPAKRRETEQEMKALRVGMKKPRSALAALSAPREELEQLRKQLGYKGTYVHGANQKSGEEVSLDQLVKGAQKVTPRSVEEIASSFGSPEELLSEMPKAPQPQKIRAQLLPYQLQGLKWLHSMENPTLPAENSKDIVQLWKRTTMARRSLFLNVATQHVTAHEPRLASGGILADDMGLGKTLEVISLITEGGPGPSLIAAPLSVMSNWVQQIERHVKSEHALKVLTYHGSNLKRNMTPKELQEYDVVITTYGMIASEYDGVKKDNGKRQQTKTGLFSLEWRRIVLDEGHNIRNPATRTALAATAIFAKSRWVLTGTPIVNTLKDLHSMLKFIGITGGLERLDVFNASLVRPLQHGDPAGEILLQTIMRSMCLRRRKEMKFVDLKLPELSEYVHRIPFRDDERKKYEALQSEARGMLEKYQKQKTGIKSAQTYRTLLEILLRLRQTCNHWQLCGKRIKDLMATLETEDLVPLTKENVEALQALLQLSIETAEECPVCLDNLHNPVITACKHVFGYECIERVINEQHKCPMCRADLEGVNVLVRPQVEGATEDVELDVDKQSSKTEALMAILQASLKKDGSKTIVFSQWTSFLDIAQKQIEDAGLKFTRIDGKMKAPERDQAMAELEFDPECRILLASLGVCSVGLNLVAADTVILCDSWWAPAIEDQAVDRVHRLGQTRPTSVWRLVMEDSIEERVLDIQKEKRELVTMAFREKGKRDKDGKTTRLSDIRKLLTG